MFAPGLSGKLHAKCSVGFYTCNGGYIYILYLPYIYILFSQEIRTATMSCIEGLSTLWPHVSKSGGKNGTYFLAQTYLTNVLSHLITCYVVSVTGRSAVWSHFLGDVLAMMVQQKKLILSDIDFLSEFFTTLLSSGHHSLLVPQSVGER